MQEMRGEMKITNGSIQDSMKNMVGSMSDGLVEFVVTLPPKTPPFANLLTPPSMTPPSANNEAAKDVNSLLAATLAMSIKTFL
jgi:hypothetical protein